MSDSAKPDGSRTVALFMPFTAVGRRIEAITFKPSTFGVLMRWQQGLIPGVNELLIELSGEPWETIEQIRHPDDGRVLAAFLDHLQPAIADDIRSGRRPASIPAEFVDAAPAPQGGAGTGTPPWPGDPIAEALQRGRGAAQGDVTEDAPSGYDEGAWGE